MGEAHASTKFFCRKFNSEQLLVEAFFDTNYKVYSVQVQSEPTFLFPCIKIFQKWQSVETLSFTLRGDRDIRPLRSWP